MMPLGRVAALGVSARRPRGTAVAARATRALPPDSLRHRRGFPVRRLRVRPGRRFADGPTRGVPRMVGEDRGVFGAERRFRSGAVVGGSRERLQVLERDLRGPLAARSPHLPGPGLDDERDGGAPRNAARSPGTPGPSGPAVRESVPAHVGDVERRRRPHPSEPHSRPARLLTQTRRASLNGGRGGNLVALPPFSQSDAHRPGPCDRRPSGLRSARAGDSAIERRRHADRTWVPSADRATSASEPTPRAAPLRDPPEWPATPVRDSPPGPCSRAVRRPGRTSRGRSRGRRRAGSRSPGSVRRPRPPR
jgi:hypothetical protein